MEDSVPNKPLPLAKELAMQGKSEWWERKYPDNPLYGTVQEKPDGEPKQAESLNGTVQEKPASEPEQIEAARETIDTAVRTDPEPELPQVAQIPSEGINAVTPNRIQAITQAVRHLVAPTVTAVSIGLGANMMASTVVYTEGNTLQALLHGGITSPAVLFSIGVVAAGVTAYDVIRHRSR